MAEGDVDVHKMVRKWTHGGAEAISSFPRDMLSQEYKSLLTAGAWALAGRPRGIGALGCVCGGEGGAGCVCRGCVGSGLAWFLSSVNVSILLETAVVHRHCPRVSGCRRVKGCVW